VIDVLGEDRPPRVPLRVRRWVAFPAVVVLALGGAGDVALRAHESAALRSCVRHADGDVVDLTNRAAAVETYAGSSLYGATAPPRVRHSLASLVEQTVAARLPALRGDRSRCEGAWHLHPSARRARRDYVAWLDLRLRQLTAASTDLDALHHDVPGQAAARDRAVRSLAELSVKP
jgi:hypothetical protein